MQCIAFTICSNNFLSYALSFANSLVEKNPGFQVVIGLADKRSASIDYAQFNPHRVISIDEIGISNLEWMTENYTIVELNTAVKPFYFEYLFKQFSPEYILFFDPDIFVYDKLESLTSRFAESDVLLTPHVINPIPKEVYPWENHFLKHGIYNLGFIGLKNTENVKSLLVWWKARLAEHCLADFRQGLYVDQLWANFIPLFFQKVEIVKEYGLNVAFWNLHERKLVKKGITFFVNDTPLLFFHFSAYDPKSPDLLTKVNYSNYNYADNADLVHLIVRYKDTLLLNNYILYSGQPFAYVFNEKKNTELTVLEKRIGRKEKILGYLGLRLIKKDNLISFIFYLLKDYMSYNNLRVGNRNDHRYDSFDFALQSRKLLNIEKATKESALAKLKNIGSSFISFLR